MCSRYRFKAEIDRLPHEFQELCETGITPRFNVAPTQPAAVVVLEDERAKVQTMRWGLVPPWSKDGKRSMINARSETAAEKPVFRDAFQHRRCLVIAHGFYEWQTVPHGKQPWHFHLKEDRLMCLAGLWEETRGGGESKIADGRSGMEDRIVAKGAGNANLPSDCSHFRSFAILTTAANSLIGRIHDRMPVILPEDGWRTWLDGRSTTSRLQELLTPFDPDDMESWPVTPRMSNVRFESEECVRPCVTNDLEFQFE